MKNVYVVKYTNLNGENPTFAIDSVFTNEEEANKYIKIQNEYHQVTKTKEYHWYFFKTIPIPLRTKALISEEPTEETE